MVDPEPEDGRIGRAKETDPVGAGMELKEVTWTPGGNVPLVPWSIGHSNH
jgi:hypothetical protein